jgi:hypothetical protein
MPITCPSKIFGLESTGKFPRFRVSMVSATIDVDWLNRRGFVLVCADLQYRLGSRSRLPAESVRRRSA